jgi:hypothetical protein
MRKKKIAKILAVCVAGIAVVVVIINLQYGCGEPSPLSKPVLLTLDCPDRTGTSLTGQGEVTDDHGAAITRRGFHYGQTPLSGVEFDGENHINAGTLGDYGSTHMEEGTIELWMKAQRALGLTYRGVITTSADDWSNLLGIWTMRPGQALGWVPYFGVFDADIRGIEGYADGVVIDDDAWHHIAVTWNCQTDTIEIYFDGVSRQVTYLRQETPSNFTNFAEDFLIGTDIWEENLVGIVSDVRIWTTIRTEQQINENMHRVLAGDEAGLFAYWRLDDWRGDTAYDSTANDNHGTLVGDPGWFVDGDTVAETGEFESGAFSLEMTGLQLATWYWARAFAENGAGTGYGNVVSCKTLDGP